jgi:hypothetical protein
MDQTPLSLFALYALPAVPSLLVCIAGIVLAVSRGAKLDATAKTVVVIALAVNVVLMVGGAALMVWVTTTVRAGGSASQAGMISGLIGLPRSLLGAAVLGALVLVALRERPSPPRA